MHKVFAGLMILAVAVLSLPSISTAQETEDHQAIRTLFQTEQEGWRNGDAAQILSCYAEGSVAYAIPIQNNQPNFLQARVAGGWKYEAWKERVLADDVEGAKAMRAESTLQAWHGYELNHINVNGNEGVAISTISNAYTDTLQKKRVQYGHQTMWLLRKIEGEWKYVGAVFPISAYRDEN